jgi:hypothetical protein
VWRCQPHPLALETAGAGIQYAARGDLSRLPSPHSAPGDAAESHCSRNGPSDWGDVSKRRKQRPSLFCWLLGGDQVRGGGEYAVPDGQTVLRGLCVRLKGGQDRAQRVLRGKIERVKNVALFFGQGRIDTDVQ